MRCDRAQVLIGVHDELDAPTRLALRVHIQSCRSCAEAWLEEAHFRRLMASRSPPAPTGRLEAALLAVPSRSLPWARLSARAGGLVPPALIVAGLTAGWLWLAAGPGLRHATGPGDRPPTFAGRGAPGDDVALPEAAATVVLRRAVDRPENRESPPALPTRPGRTSSGSDRLGSNDRVSYGAARIGAAALRRAPAPIVGAPTPDRSLAVPPSPGDPNDDPRHPGGPPPVAGLPAVSTPTAPPPQASPTAVVWRLALTVQVEEPGADLTGAMVVVQVDAQVDGAWATRYEEALPFIGLTARAEAVLDRPPPYRVELFSSLAEHPVCPGESRLRSVDAGALVEGRGAVTFRLCPAPTAVPATPTPGDTPTPDVTPTAVGAVWHPSPGNAVGGGPGSLPRHSN